MNDRAVRVIERWGLVAGVTGVVANLLLIALYALALPGVGDYDWTGPANDVMGVVSSAAIIPVAFALRDLVGGGALVRWLTMATAAALALTVVLSLLLVTDVIPFEAQAAGAIPVIVVLFVWLGLIGRAGAASEALPGWAARTAMAMSVLMVAGMAIGAGALALPWESAAQYIVFGAAAVIGAPGYLGFPVWLIVLSGRLRGHA